MTEPSLRAVIRELLRLAWARTMEATAWLLDLGRNLGGLWGGVLVLLLVLLALGVGFWMQRSLNRRLRDRPDTPVNMLIFEWRFSLLGLLLSPVLIPLYLLIRALGGFRGYLVRPATTIAQRPRRARRRKEDPEDPARESEVSPASEAEDPEPPLPPVLVATLGPSFHLAGLFTAALWLLATVTEPLLRSQLHLSPGHPAWQYVFLGGRPELAWYLPLQRFPFLGGLLVAWFWLVLWWTLARGIRLWWGRDLGRNLAGEPAGASSRLRPWRSLFAAPELWRPTDAYKRWAVFFPLVTAPLLVAAWFALAGTPYRVEPSLFSTGLVLCLGWTLHLKCVGFRREAETRPEQEQTVLAEAHGWDAVLSHLKEEHQAVRPHPFAPPRAIPPLDTASEQPGELVSPLVLELLPGDGALTRMQRDVLTHLSLQAHLHTDPPVEAEAQALHLAGRGADLPSDTARERIVLAPEGSGRTTLGLLAAANQVVVHSTTVLVVVRGEPEARAWTETFRRRLEPSLLRWNLRLRRVGGDLARDLAQGIVPDVVVTDLSGLVTRVLDDTATWGAFLGRVGLVLVDDVESFCGPVEVHAQLAFRRLRLRLGEVQGVRELGRETAPQLLVLGCDSMQDTPAWIRTLCGIEGAIHRFEPADPAAPAAASPPEGAGSDASAAEDPSLEDPSLEDPSLEDPSLEDPGPERRLRRIRAGRHHTFFRLGDFRTVTGERLSLLHLVEACERLEVPWTWRLAGDTGRRLGRSPLLLPQDPRAFTPQVEDACVVLVQGEWSAVRRELVRLRRAGARFSRFRRSQGSPGGGPGSPPSADRCSDPPTSPEPEPVALVTVVDPDLDMAFTSLDRNAELRQVLHRLPRPIVRAPSGHIRERHLSSELVANWTETAGILAVFGDASARILERLARRGLLLLEERVDVEDRRPAYERLVYVRALARAVAGDPEGQARVRGEGVLPPRVHHVEHATERVVEIRDHTRMGLVGHTDAASAAHTFPAGRIFVNEHGRYVVMGRAADILGLERAERAGLEAGAVVVEPFLEPVISTPRRRSRVTLDAEGGAAPLHGPEPLLMGSLPVAVAQGPARVTTRHVATYQLGPEWCEIHQRQVYEPDDPASREYTLHTEALLIRPNPAFSDYPLPEGAPRLDLEAARLVAAAMRAVLPSVYRGAEDALAVALHVEQPHPEREHVLGPEDAFVLYDLHHQGNNASRAVHRDGVELLLRLCRLVIERVLYHDRLRARYDTWGDRREVLTGAGIVDRGLRERKRATETATADGAADPPEPDPAKQDRDLQDRDLQDRDLQDQDPREQDRRIRRRALAWLDSRLRPEGLDASIATTGQYGSGIEEGEGDFFDLGRCWYTPDGSLSDLLWTRHLWELEGGGLAGVDVGIHRQIAAESRFLTEQSEALAAHREAFLRTLDDPAFALPDGTRWGGLRPALLPPEPGDSEQPPRPAEPGAGDLDSAREHYHPLSVALAAWSWPALGPLAELLGDRAGGGLDTEQDRYRLATFAARFVQGIPYSVPGALRGGLRPPVSTLLYRLGDCDSKSLLLALLLEHRGLEAGLFVSFQERHALAAVAAPLPHAGDEPGQDPGHVAAWAEQVGLSRPPRFWAEMPVAPGDHRHLCFVPVESTAYLPVGREEVRSPASWIFLPLTAAWLRVGARSNPFAAELPRDRAEHEGVE